LKIFRIFFVAPDSTGPFINQPRFTGFPFEAHFINIDPIPSFASSHRKKFATFSFDDQPCFTPQGEAQIVNMP